MTDAQAKGSEAFVDSMTNLGVVVESVKISLGTQLMPIIQNMAKEFQAFVKENRPAITAFFKDFAKKIPGFLKQTVKAFKDLWTTLKPVAELFIKLIKFVGPAKALLVGLATFIAGPLGKENESFKEECAPCYLPHSLSSMPKIGLNRTTAKRFSL